MPYSLPATVRPLAMNSIVLQMTSVLKNTLLLAHICMKWFIAEQAGVIRPSARLAERSLSVGLWECDFNPYRDYHHTLTTPAILIHLSLRYHPHLQDTVSFTVFAKTRID